MFLQSHYHFPPRNEFSPTSDPRSRLRRMAVKSVTGQHINDSFNSSRCLSEKPLGADGNPLELVGIYIPRKKGKSSTQKVFWEGTQLVPRRREHHQLEMSTPTLIKKKAEHTILLHTTHKLLEYLVIQYLNIISPTSKSPTTQFFCWISAKISWGSSLNIAPRLFFGSWSSPFATTGTWALLQPQPCAVQWLGLRQWGDEGSWINATW